MYNAPQMTKYSQHFINNIILISINIKNQKPLKKGDLKLTILKKKLSQEICLKVLKLLTVYISGYSDHCELQNR